METFNIVIDGTEVQVERGETVLEAARKIGIDIPTLCHLKGIHEPSSCRVCVVEAGPKLIASCTLKAEPGMQIRTNTAKVREARRTVIELLLSDHKRECTSCIRSDDCRLQDLASQLNVRDVRYKGEHARSAIDVSSPSIMRDAEKCILCGRCVSVCGDVQTVHAIGLAGRGFTTSVGPVYNRALGESVCVNCGQCVMVCPVGALTERENIADVWRALADESKFVVVQTAPAIRVALGEAFGMPPGSRVTGKMAAALRRLGFDRVFDTNFGADMTIMEEGTELVGRLMSGQNLPLMTSCCPGWVKFVEHCFPDMLDHLSTSKSPHEMEGAIIKSCLAGKLGIDPKSIVVVSIMPCTAKKYESSREELSRDGMQDVDIVLTTRELARMIKEAGIDFNRLPDEDFDNPIGHGSGAAAIFGATGGVAEAALRTVYEIVSGETLEKIDFEQVRGLDGIKRSEIELPDGTKVKTAVVHGLGNARKLMEMVREGAVDLDFIEVMACPGGCVAGGGQPIVTDKCRDMDIRAVRAKAIYEEDKDLPVRQSHKNPYVKQLYEAFIGEPNGHLAHELLHTHYKPRSRF
jgi:NADH-quinone oxidoreductase subunit G/NADP-reducing hydrogenase subunit HndD